VTSIVTATTSASGLVHVISTLRKRVGRTLRPDAALVYADGVPRVRQTGFFCKCFLGRCLLEDVELVLKGQAATWVGEMALAG
jgi:hypothetical protein